MDVGIGLNATVPGVAGRDILDWARAADDGPLSSLGIIDRIAYPNHEPLTVLAAVAAVTRRVRLTTTVLVAPIRNPGLLAKQAATIDSLSAGRLTLGVGIGGREEDYLAAGSDTDFARRATALEDQLDLLRRVWAGEPPVDGVGSIGPRPASHGGPEVLVGGYSTPAARRAGRLADGFIAGNVAPDRARAFYDEAVAARKEAGRDGGFRFVICGYFCLGDAATVERGRDNLRDYYGFSADGGQGAADSLHAGEDAVRERLAACEEHGADEVILWPAVPDVDQVERFAAVVEARR